MKKSGVREGGPGHEDSETVVLRWIQGWGGITEGISCEPLLVCSGDKQMDLQRIRMFADNIRICSESRNKVEQSMERWTYAPERRGITVSGRRP